MDAMTTGDGSQWRRWLGMGVAVATLVAGAASFLPSQSLWGDEGTQLVGLTLDPSAVARWLAGREPHDFGQFPDRMPPASYWAGRAWGQVFGIGETAMRWFGVLCVASATAVVFEAARRAYGTAAGWVAGLLLATSPSLVVTAVEIRAYPMFLLASAVALALLLRLVEDRTARWPWHAALAITLATAMATHFFGFALAGAVVVAALAMTWRRPGRISALLASSAALALAGYALLPFVRAATAIGNRQAEGSIPVMARLEAFAKLWPALIDHPSLMVYRPVEWCVLGAAVVLGWAASRSRSSATRAVALTLGAGLGAVALVEIGFARPRFNVCSPNYNIWTRPGLCLLAASGLAAPGPRTRRLAATASVLLIAAQAFGVYELATDGGHFAHGPHRAIAALIRDLGPADVAVVHDEAGEKFVYIANPIRFDFGTGLEQFRLLDPADPSRVAPLLGDPSPRPIASLPQRYLVVIRPALVGDKDLAGQVRHGDRPMPAGPIVRAGRLLDGRRRILQTQRVAYISARIDVFERPSP